LESSTVIINYCIIITDALYNECIVKGKAVPLQALKRHGGFQEVKVPIFHDNGTGWW
jgi:hypothetical protein